MVNKTFSCVYYLVLYKVLLPNATCQLFVLLYVSVSVLSNPGEYVQKKKSDSHFGSSELDTKSQL